MDTFLLTYRAFTTSKVVWDALIERYISYPFQISYRYSHWLIHIYIHTHTLFRYNMYNNVTAQPVVSVQDSYPGDSRWSTLIRIEQDQMTNQKMRLR